MKLEKFIAKRLGIGRREARLRLLDGRVSIEGIVTTGHCHEVSRFDEIVCDGACLQPSRARLYLMLHKPVGVLSATKDTIHHTVLDLIDHPNKESLHLAGRLDRSSSGLVLLSNDGPWSEALTIPGRKVGKEYLVETDRPIPHEAISLFAAGFHFATENIMTLPATLEILAPTCARVTLHEGRYHQIKRMFHRVDGIRLRSLHRERIGPITLPDDLAPGAWRPLSPMEVSSFRTN
jgi:16S rRNA pseudouridine516 synthase